MTDHRRLPERIDRELDLVAEAVGADLDVAGRAIENLASLRRLIVHFFGAHDQPWRFL